MNIEAMAKKAGFTVANGSYGLKFSGGDLEGFARLVAEAEREACARVCRDLADGCRKVRGSSSAEMMQAYEYAEAEILKRRLLRG